MSRQTKKQISIGTPEKYAKSLDRFYVDADGVKHDITDLPWHNEHKNDLAKRAEQRKAESDPDTTVSNRP